MGDRGFIDWMRTSVIGGNVDIGSGQSVHVRGIGEMLFGGLPPAIVPNTPALIVAAILQFVFGLLGIIFTILILYHGFEWMTSKGEQEKIETSRAGILHAVIGLFFALIAYGFVNVFSEALLASVISSP